MFVQKGNLTSKMGYLHDKTKASDIGQLDGDC